MRDKNGGYKLDVPALPNSLIGEDGEELNELEPDESGEIGLPATELGGRDKESTFYVYAQLSLLLCGVAYHGMRG